MEWIEALQGKVVSLDTTPLIYFIEENPAYLDMLHPFFEANDARLPSSPGPRLSVSIG